MSNVYRGIDCADACAAAIVAAWNGTDTPMGGNDACTREYELPLQENDLKGLLGRKAFVFPMRFQRNDKASREEYFSDQIIRVAVAERYTDGTGLVPTAWLDARTNWLFACVVNALDFDIESDYATGLLDDSWWTLDIDCDVYSPADLAQLKLWYAEVTVTFREAAAP